jgi:predicted tellurium resistance membrane protein TerC
MKFLLIIILAFLGATLLVEGLSDPALGVVMLGAIVVIVASFVRLCYKLWTAHRRKGKVE